MAVEVTAIVSPRGVATLESATRVLAGGMVVGGDQVVGP